MVLCINAGAKVILFVGFAIALVGNLLVIPAFFNKLTVCIVFVWLVFRGYDAFSCWLKVFCLSPFYYLCTVLLTI